MTASSEPFAPPAEQDPAEAANLSSVLAAWAMAGAVVGTSVGTTMQLVGQVEGSAAVGLSGAGAGAVFGFLAWLIDRQAAASRPSVVDGKGRLTKPASVALMAVPMGAAAIGLAGLVVVASVSAGSLVYGGAFAFVLLGLGWFTRPLVTSHRVGQAVQLAEGGDTDLARRLFLKIVDGWWITGSGRAQAQLNLGLLALRDGDLEMAARWYELPARSHKGKVGAFACSGLALVRTLQGRWSEAEAFLHKAQTRGRGALQPEVDGVRLLMVLRRDGAIEAREMGERLLALNSGSVFCAALAISREQTGHPDEARDLLEGGIGAGLRASGIVALMPELEELV